jgi:hypothetical protein
MERILFFTVYPVQLDNPLIRSNIRFRDSAKSLRISVETAQVLDDMRFLTTTILAMSQISVSKIEETKFIATASWIHERLSAPLNPNLATDFLYQSCRNAAIIFSLAILTRTPLSQACTSELLYQLWMTQWRVPLTRWKETPGIFLWIALVSAPFAQDLPMGRWHKGMIASSTIAIGLVDWDVAMATLRGFLAVQRWLKGDRDKKFLVRFSEEGKTHKRAASV